MDHLNILLHAAMLLRNYSLTDLLSITVVCRVVQELSPLLPKALDMSLADEESMDCPSSVDQSFNDASSYHGDSVAENTPTSSKKKKVVAWHRVQS